MAAAEEEPVKALTEQTIATLEQFWATIGTDATEQEQVLRSLHESVEGVFKGTLQTWQQEKDALEAKIAADTEEIHAMSRQLCDEEDVQEELSAVDRTQPLRRVAFEVSQIHERLAQKRTLRSNVLSGFLEKIHALCADLGAEPVAPFDSVGAVLSKEMVHQYETELKRLETEKAARVDHVAFLVSSVSDLWTELDVPEDERQLPGCVEEHIGVSDEAIAAVEACHKALEDEKLRRIKEIDGFSRAILALWDRLEVPVEARKGFSAIVQGLTPDILEIYRSELARLQELKVSKLVELVGTARESIAAVQDELRMTPEQRAAEFPLATGEDFSEESLVEHERYLELLNERMETYRPLIALVEKRDAMIIDIEHFHATESERDESRLNSRESFKILRYEEKMRKVEKKTLPQLEAKIVKKVTKWEEDSGLEFLINGERYAETVAAAIEERKSAQRQRGRKPGAVLRGTASTPNVRSSNKRPPVARNESSQSVRASSTAKKKKRTAAKKQRDLVQTPQQPNLDQPATPTREEIKPRAESPAFPGEQKADRDADSDDGENREPNEHGEQPTTETSTAKGGTAEMEDVCKFLSDEVLMDLNYEAQAALDDGNYEMALALFSKAIEGIKIDQSTADLATDLYHGRSQVYSKLARHQESLRDSATALQVHELHDDGTD